MRRARARHSVPFGGFSSTRLDSRQKSCRVVSCHFMCSGGRPSPPFSSSLRVRVVVVFVSGEAEGGSAPLHSLRSSSRRREREVNTYNTTVPIRVLVHLRTSSCTAQTKSKHLRMLSAQVARDYTVDCEIEHQCSLYAHRPNFDQSAAL